VFIDNQLIKQFDIIATLFYDDFINPIMEKRESWYCYILRSTNPQYKNCTYNGSTNDPFRRLRQHNEEIKGGAKATHGRGIWEIYVLLTGFPDHVNALSCEWRIKCPSGRPGKRSSQHNGVIGRVKSLNNILVLDQWTKQCIVKNADCYFRLIVRDDVKQYIDVEKLPANIEVISVPEILPEHLEE
jgi:predicted GIY-YIG superfamily endonuclease